MEKLTNLDHLRAASLAAKGLIGEVAGATAEALGEMAEALEELKAQQQGGSSSQAGGNIPSGGIIVWSGASDAVPAGWALCDGENGTPDLRDRFVLGAGGSYGVGATGGEETHTLTTSEMPRHTHTLPGYEGGSTTTSYEPGVSKVKIYYNRISTGSAGSGSAHNNMPPYYVLCYIMKL